MKYIDSEKLIAGIKHLQEKFPVATYEALDHLIASLQQELPNNEGKGIPGKDFIPVEWVDACERYGKWKIIKEQPEVDLEKEVSNYLQKHHLHIKDGGRVVFNNDDSPNFMCDIRDIARHFYELGRARKEQ